MDERYYIMVMTKYNINTLNDFVLLNTITWDYKETNMGLYCTKYCVDRKHRMQSTLCTVFKR